LKLAPHLFTTGMTLMPGVPLNIYALRGSDYAVIIDTGIAGMRDQVLDLCREAGGVRYALITHAHADHIGCNVAVRGAFGARFAAAGALPWIEDLETHYREFCLLNAELPNSPEQKAEIMGLMDGPVHVDIVLTEGTTFRLGTDVELTTIPLPGHKLEEVGFLDEARGDLFMGDLLLALAAPFFHGFDTERGFRDSLRRVGTLIEAGRVKRIFPAHHAMLNADDAQKAIAVTSAFLDDFRGATIDAATGVAFPDLWRDVCAKLNKQLEFRGYAMVEAQVRELVEDGVLRRDGDRIVRA
jgi:glyoxylase-like metal-dependent hydrolase (beta-lactamase superfamily II)